MSSATDATSSVRPCAGFTLIEMICSLVLLGVIGTLSFSVLSAGAKAYTETRNLSRKMTQTSLALNRLHKELYRLDTVESFSERRLIFTTAPVSASSQPSEDSRITLEYLPDERTVLLQGSPLLQGVRKMTLRLRSADGIWKPGMPASQLSFVEMELIMDSARTEGVRMNLNTGEAKSATVENPGVFRIGVCTRYNGSRAGSPVLPAGGKP